MSNCNSLEREPADYIVAKDYKSEWAKWATGHSDQF